MAGSGNTLAGGVLWIAKWEAKTTNGDWGLNARMWKFCGLGKRLYLRFQKINKNWFCSCEKLIKLKKIYIFLTTKSQTVIWMRLKTIFNWQHIEWHQFDTDKKCWKARKHGFCNYYINETTLNSLEGIINYAWRLSIKKEASKNKNDNLMSSLLWSKEKQKLSQPARCICALRTQPHTTAHTTPHNTHQILSTVHRLMSDVRWKPSPSFRVQQYNLLA